MDLAPSRPDPCPDVIGTRWAWAAVIALYIAGVVYQTLGIFREISSFIDAPLFESPATAPEIIAMAAVPLSDYIVPGIALALIATLPPVGDAHVIARIGSRARAVWLPARAAAPALAGGMAIWLGVCAILASRARWVDHWVTIDGIQTLSPTTAEALPAGSISPLGSIVLALVNLSATFLAISLWAGLAATFISRRAVAICLFALVVVLYASSLWESVIPLGTWFGIEAVMRQFPPGISATAVLLAIGALPLLIGAVADIHRSGRLPARRAILAVIAALICGLTISSGRVLDVTGDLGDALLIDLHGSRLGSDIGPSLPALLTVQVFSLFPAVVMLVKVEEYIALWPMVHARGAGSLRWFLFLVRDSARVALAVSMLPIVALLLATLGQPRALGSVDLGDLATGAYWVLATVLQATLYATVLCTVRLASSSIPLWCAVFGVLFVAPELIAPRTVPVGLNHLLVLDESSLHDAIQNLAVLAMTLAALSIAIVLAVKNQLIAPEA